MKKLIIIALILIGSSLTAFAQIDTGFNYQAILKENGVVLKDTAVEVKFTILLKTSQGLSNTIYSETHTTRTSTGGTISLVVGKGDNPSSDFTSLDWASNASGFAYQLNVQIRTGLGSFIDMGTQDLYSVPVSLYAKEAGTARSVLNDKVNDADASPTNEIQTVTFSSSSKTLSLSRNGGSADLSSLDETEAGLDWRVYTTNRTASSTSITSFGNVTISAPESGYVLVNATASGTLVTLTSVDFNIGFGTSGNSFQRSMMIERNQSTGLSTIRKEIAFTYAFPVSAGNNTFYFNGQRVGGTSNSVLSLQGLNLTALFVPKRY